MKLKLLISITNKTIRLVNVDALNTDASLERDLDCWACPAGENITVTYWDNAKRNKLNCYKYNRVNIHYTLSDHRRVTKSYYCIEEVLFIEEMTLGNFDSSTIQ